MSRSLSGLLLLVPALLSAQGHDHGAAPKIDHPGVPAGWSLRTDAPRQDAQVSLATVPPGWHLTTATSGIMWRAADSAAGTYEVSSKLHLFPGSGDHAEAFGLFIGGSGLTGASPRYTYFLIRGDGTFKVKAMNGTRTRDITPGWTASTAIVKAKADGPVANVVTVAVGKDKVSFRVNGTEVWSGPAAGLDMAGVAGLRVNHNLSLHVETLDLKRS